MAKKNKTLQSEIQQSVPFESQETESILNIVYTANYLVRKTNELLKPYKLNNVTYNALRIVRGAGQAGIPCLEIGKRLIWVVPDITRLVDNLEKAGLVLRARSDEDRRVVYVQITEEGKTLLAELDEPMRRKNQNLLKHLSPEEILKISLLMEKVREGSEKEF